jgi:hypothetical protein
MGLLLTARPGLAASALQVPVETRNLEVCPPLSVNNIWLHLEVGEVSALSFLNLFFF